MIKDNIKKEIARWQWETCRKLRPLFHVQSLSSDGMIIFYLISYISLYFFLSQTNSEIELGFFLILLNNLYFFRV